MSSGSTPSNPFEAPRELPRSVAEEESAVLATKGARLGAKLIDWLVHGLATVPGLILVALSEPSADTLLASVAVLLGFLLLVAGGLGVPLYNWYLTATQGKTIGKRALGIRVVLLDGGPVNYLSGVIMRVWLMTLIKGIASLVNMSGLVSLVDVATIFSSSRRCLHDYLAGTKVIES